MLRSSRPILNSASRLALASRPSTARLAKLPAASPISKLNVLPVAVYKTAPLVLRTAFSSKHPTPQDKIDKKHEEEIAKHKLEARPDEVSTTSTIANLNDATPTRGKVDPIKGFEKELVCQLTTRVTCFLQHCN